MPRNPNQSHRPGNQVKTVPVEDCVFKHLNLESQRVVSQKVVDHTYRLFGTQLLYAKDVPTYHVTNSQAL